jgi:hypothetical protein
LKVMRNDYIRRAAPAVGQHGMTEDGQAFV